MTDVRQLRPRSRLNRRADSGRSSQGVKKYLGDQFFRIEEMNYIFYEEVSLGSGSSTKLDWEFGSEFG